MKFGICSHCMRPLTIDDEIIFCPSCNAPHHKECRDKIHKCAACGHSAELSPDVSEPPANKAAEEAYPPAYEDSIQSKHASSLTDIPVNCRACGNIIGSGDAFCRHCGYSVSHETVNQPSSAHKPDGEYYAKADWEKTLIGRRADYYQRQFKKMRNSGRNNSWNWAALLAGPFWFIYRRMTEYAVGLTALAVFLAVNFDGMLRDISAASLIILTAVYANCLYMKKIDGKLDAAMSYSIHNREKYIRQCGGIKTGRATAAAFLFIGLTAAAVFVPEIVKDNSYYHPPKADICYIPGCNNKPEYGAYCHEHICTYEGCYRVRLAHSLFCPRHGLEAVSADKLCIADSCENYGEFSGICIEHVCLAGYCTELRLPDGEYCERHLDSACIADGCGEMAEYGEYCINHVCQEIDCTNAAIPDSDYCQEHSYYDEPNVQELSAADAERY